MSDGSLALTAARRVDAPPRRLFRAFGRVSLDDLQVAETRVAARAALRVLASGAEPGEPAYARLFSKGFTVVRSDPLREIVVRRPLVPGSLLRPLFGALSIRLACSPRPSGVEVRVECRLSRSLIVWPLALLVWRYARRAIAGPLFDAWFDALERDVAAQEARTSASGAVPA